MFRCGAYLIGVRTERAGHNTPEQEESGPRVATPHRTCHGAGIPTDAAASGRNALFSCCVTARVIRRRVDQYTKISVRILILMGAGSMPLRGLDQIGI